MYDKPYQLACTDLLLMQHPVDFDIFCRRCQVTLAPDDLHETEEVAGLLRRGSAAGYCKTMRTYSALGRPGQDPPPAC